MQPLSRRTQRPQRANSGHARRSPRLLEYNPLYLKSDIPILRLVPGSV
jgi:hypothetical protein